jgi:hypothetical protein
MLEIVIVLSSFIFLLISIEVIFIINQLLGGTLFKDLDWNFLNWFSKKKKIKVDSSSAPAPAPALKNVCTFSRLDLMKKRIIDKDKKIVEPSDIKYDTNGNVVSGGIDCDSCGDYKYMTIKGCNTLKYDSIYSGTGTGLCTSVGFPDKC